MQGPGVGVQGDRVTLTLGLSPFSTAVPAGIPSLQGVSPPRVSLEVVGCFPSTGRGLYPTLGPTFVPPAIGQELRGWALSLAAGQGGLGGDPRSSGKGIGVDPVVSRDLWGMQGPFRAGQGDWEAGIPGSPAPSQQVGPACLLKGRWGEMQPIAMVLL